MNSFVIRLLVYVNEESHKLLFFFPPFENQIEGMAKIRDRTEDFKDAARRAALNLEYNEVLPLSVFVYISVYHGLLDGSRASTLNS